MNADLSTREGRVAFANTLLTDKFFQFLGDLYSRYQDEKNYEDFKDYETVMKKNLPETAGFIKGTIRPFGFQMRPMGFFYTIQVYVTSKGAGWKSI